ncbi:aminopeptidase P N-terminal domain-containing protein [Sulfurimonas sp.]|nr:aminopeptidase P N-terminal domain-containing protein [Sulfurimonas sp.]
MIKESEYKKRRDILGKKLRNNSIAIILSSEHKKRSNDTEYPYRQDSNFYYLTGFKEDNSVLVFVKSKKEIKTILFVQKKDAQLELWNGKRVGEKKAKKIFNVDKVFSSDRLTEVLDKYKEKKRLFFDLTCKDKRVKKFSKNFSKHEDIRKIIESMRLIKSSSEIKLIKNAISITTKAHHNAIKFKKPGKNEYELQSEIEYDFKKRGAYSDAYTSIVACGNSANTLHYIQNNQALVDGELILIDAGCEYDYYASDITRTIPVNGRFSKPQKDLYNLVLDTQLRIIEMIKPNILRSDLHKKSEELLTRGMIELGILKGNYKKLIKNKKHKKYYPHGIGHWMGIDVHDQAPYKDEKDKEIPLKKGMVLTIEPGLYIDKNDKNVPKKYRGIGIRIEDDILVTSTSSENLSEGIVKSIKDIEKMSSKF